ncbi:MAG: ATP-binding cassette domain-containing protein [Nakamurella sp.]
MKRDQPSRSEKAGVDPSIAIDVHGLRKNYGGPAGGAGLNGFDLQIPAGTVHGLLGPNGAGKTTAIRILTTLLRMDAGTAMVAGHDVRRSGRQVRRHIGLVGQAAAVDDVLTGKQNLLLVGRLNHLPGAAAVRRADELLERFSLTEAGGRKVATYSGGMRRRLDLAAALVVAPQVLFVDEPTTGLDPQGRRAVWSAIRDLVATGTTVLLTTQYLEEADQLADRISVLQSGRIMADGTPDELKAIIGGDWLDVSVADPAEFPALRALATRFATGEVLLDENTLQVSISVNDRTKALVGLSAALAESALEPLDLSVRRPTLDEVFLQLTGDGAASQQPDPMTESKVQA